MFGAGSFLRLTALLIYAAESREVVTAAIDCSSGTPDLNSGVTSVSQDECRTQCDNNCATSVKTTDDLERCLTNESIRGCLFQVSTAQEHSVDFCVKQQVDTEMSLTGDHLMIKVSGEDLYVTGQTVSSVPNDSMAVNEVTLIVELQDSTKFRSCSNKTVKIGVSSVPFDKSTCPFEGSLSTQKAYTVSNDGEDMVIPIGDALKGLWGQQQDAVVIIQLQDAVCGHLTAEDATAYFSITYQAGYIDTSICGDIKDCLQCQVANCHWCSWSSAVNTMLPDWLPDWQWVNSAKSSVNGNCGLNSVLCKMSLGEFDVCSAPKATAVGVIGMTIMAGVTIAALWH